MLVVDKIIIDITKKGNRPVVYAVQNDSNSRIVELQLYSGGTPFDLNSNDKTFSVVFKKPDGHNGWYDMLPDGSDAITVDGNVASVVLAPQVLTTPGLVDVGLRIDEGLMNLTTFPFIVDVEEDPASGGVESNDYYSVKNWGELNEALRNVAKIDDASVDSSSAWSARKILEMIAQGGTGNIDMGGRNIWQAGAIETQVISVSPDDSEGFSIESVLEDDNFTDPVAVFSGTNDGEPVIVRNIAPGTQSGDAVNKGQLDEAMAETVQIDDTKVGSDAWSSKNIVDKLCPAFSESGLLVQCEPVEGYPLSVQAREGSEQSGVTVTVCGKNIYNPAPVEEGGYPLKDGYYINRGSGAEAGSGTHADYCATREYIPVDHLRGRYINLNHIPGGTAPGMAFYNADKEFLGSAVSGKGDNILVPDGAVYMRFCTYITKKDETQIEVGSQATEYEPYCGKTEAGADGKAVVTAVKGINNVFAYSGDTAVEITVTGRSNPVAIIDKLTQAVISLGGNI